MTWRKLARAWCRGRKKRPRVASYGCTSRGTALQTARGWMDETIGSGIAAASRGWSPDRGPGRGSFPARLKRCTLGGRRRTRCWSNGLVSRTSTASGCRERRSSRTRTIYDGFHATSRSGAPLLPPPSPRLPPPAPPPPPPAPRARTRTTLSRSRRCSLRRLAPTARHRSFSSSGAACLTARRPGRTPLRWRQSGAQWSSFGSARPPHAPPPPRREIRPTAAAGRTRSWRRPPCLAAG
mmetsp:Transcript_31726/g.105901  ORF Transcript_31726/g.105901 Transcript_31726/m.105901 type:complete len:238 (+) Transcript_31726:138-851(+)